MIYLYLYFCINCGIIFGLAYIINLWYGDINSCIQETRFDLEDEDYGDFTDRELLVLKISVIILLFFIALPLIAASYVAHHYKD